MLIAKIKSKLDGNKSLFDLQTQQTANNKFDLVISPQGQVNRVIGIDKLIQHTLKYMLVNKGTYTDFLIGTSINNIKVLQKNEFSLKSEIVTSLTEYSKYQVRNSVFDVNILGYDIYRTQTPNNAKSWVKLNKRLNSNNFYFDSNLNANETYYYSVVPVHSVNNRPVSSGITATLGIVIPSTDTLNAVVTNSFIAVPKKNSVTLYWTKGIAYQSEEVLRSIVKLNTWFTPGEIRDLNIYIELTNLDHTVVPVTAISA